jgi:hypothetical protein
LDNFLLCICHSTFWCVAWWCVFNNVQEQYSHIRPHL